MTVSLNWAIGVVFLGVSLTLLYFVVQGEIAGRPISSNWLYVVVAAGIIGVVSLIDAVVSWLP
jgi:hypothetical protein